MIKMKDFFKKLLKNPFIINLMGMIIVSCLLIWGVLGWLNKYTHHNEAVEVPDVKGLSIEEGAAFFQNNGLRYDVIDSVFSKNVAPGSIVELSPKAGSKVKEGRIVYVTINATTSQMAVIPEIEDLSFRQAYALLQSLGFTAIETKYVPGIYKDLALGIEVNERIIQPGEMLPLASSLVLIVSSGEELPPDSLQQEVPLIQPLDSDVERWF